MAHEITAMKSMLRVKLQHIIQCFENGRTLNIEDKVRETYELMLQLSLLTCLDGPVNFLKQALDLMKNDCGINNSHHIEMPLQCGKTGRPKVFIPFSILEFLVINKFTVKDISGLSSESTIKRRLKEYNLMIGSTYSSIGQEQLEELVRNITNEYPNAGYRTVSGVLSSKGKQAFIKKICKKICLKHTTFVYKFHV